MWWNRTAGRAVGCAVLTSALTAGILPSAVLAASPRADVAADEGPSTRPGAGDDGLAVTEQTVRIEADRPAEVHVDHDDDEAPATTGPYASVEVIHESSPEMLILPDVAPDTVLAVRSHGDGAWTDWVEVSANPDEAPDGRPGEEGAHGTPGIGPIWIGHDADRTEIALLHGSTGPLTVEELDVSDVPAAVRSSASVDGPSRLRSSTASPAFAAAAAGQPTIRPRSAWAPSTMGWNCPGTPDRSENLTAAVVHHTASTTDYAPGDVPGILRAFYRYHTQSNGWCDIAYNFLVDRFGTIWEGRLGGIDQPVVGGHAKGFNTNTMGVALVGEFGSAPAYTAMIGSTSRLIAWKFALHGVDPLGFTQLQNRASTGPLKFPAGALVNVPTVIGHRDLGLTSCPGSNVYATVAGIRRSLATSDRVGSPPFVFDRWSAASTGIAVATVDSDGGIRVAGAARQTPTVVSGAPVAIDGAQGRGYVLTSDGRLTAFSGAPDRQVSLAAPPVDLIVRSGGDAGWVVDRDGRFTGFGGVGSKPSPITSGTVVAADVDDDGAGYLVTSTGALAPIGGSPVRSISTGGSTPIDVVVRSDRASGWVLTADGVSRGFGGAPTLARAAGSSAARALLLAGEEDGTQVLDADGRIWPTGSTPAVTPVASHVGIGNAVSAGRIGRAGLGGTETAKVVSAQHELFLRSTPVDERLEKWFHTTEHLGRVGTALQMARSDEYAGLVVDDLYRRVLGRTADPGGRANWLNAIRGGMRIEAVGAEFYGSTEYVQRAGSFPAYVELLYENLLFRRSDPDGKAGWVDALRTYRLTPKQVSAGFYNSIESRRDRVTRLYVSILRREPDPGGLAHWAEQLLSRDDLVLAAELAGSREYRTRVLQGTL